MDGNKLRKNKAKESMQKAKSWTKTTVTKVGQVVDKALDWAIQNPEKTAILGTSALAIKKYIDKSKERTYEDKRASYWDGRNQWTLKRPMTPREQLMFRRRLDCGEEAYEILLDMGLLSMRRF